MPGRSLVACSEGIDKARKALQRYNLTQTAIAKELAIASWSTVNKFFNGKPVERAIFMEICFQLNLDWQEIAGTLDDVDAEIESESDEEAKHVESIIEEAFTNATPVSVELETLWLNAQRTRQALNPYILPTIRREELLGKCLTQIQVGLDGKKRVLPILGAAGYGKSTILGTIYDELSRNCLETNTGWIALARCDDLVESAENFAKELGEKVSDRRLSIIEVAQQLSEIKGRGVLLLDTLDIVLTKPLVSVFRLIVSQLLDCGTTVVFTCRDNDYAAFFEPYHESFAGFREAVYNGCTVPQFSESEIAAAAENFARQKSAYPTKESQSDFARKILALSADSVSLAEIVSNPLLLALLCELFAEAEIVPEDLTVSQLYEIYWQWKIGKSRHAQASPIIGKAKEKMCLFLAETLYQKSTDRLRDFVYETTFDLTDEADFAAYTALRSDGILKDLGNSRISFFHQTFLEYAIARWLNVTETGEVTKSQIRRQLEINHPTELPSYIWSIFRQLLTLVELTEFNQLCQELDRQELLPFRAIAFAAVSRTSPESSQILLDLFEIALSKEYGFTEALLIAANSAPKRHGETVWSIIIKLLAVIGQELINKTIEIAAQLMARDNQTAEKFTQAVQALSSNSLMQDAEKRHSFWGKFLKAFYRIVREKEKTIDDLILETIKQQYSEFGSNVRAIAIDLYLTSGVTEIVQRDFLFTILETPTANNSFVEKENAIELLSRLLPSLLESGDSVFGDSWLTALDAPLSREWLSVTAAVVGKKAASDAYLMAEIMAALFDEPFPSNSKLFNRSSTIALQEAIQAGGGYCLANLLLNRSIDKILKNRISTLAKILNNLADISLQPNQDIALKQEDFSEINQTMIVQIAEWVSPIIYQEPVDLIPVMDALGMRSLQVREILADLLPPLLNSLKSESANQILKKLSWIPLSLESYLENHRQSKEARIALLKLYYQQLESDDSQDRITEIVQFCLDVSQDVAKEAAWKVLELTRAKKIISVAALLPILTQAKPIVVRQNCLQAIVEQVNLKQVSSEEIARVLAAIAQETAPQVLQLAYKLVTAAIWNHPSGDRYLELPIAEAIFSLTRSIVKTAPQMTLDMIANAAFISFNQMVLLEDKRLISGLTECTRLLLSSVDIRSKIDSLIITGLLNNLGKFDSQFLETIVQEDVLNSAKILPVGNLPALVVAISNNQGKMSPLLDLMLQSEKVPHETKSRILRERNL